MGAKECLLYNPVVNTTRLLRLFNEIFMMVIILHALPENTSITCLNQRS